jgi:molecular chaperone GrpE
MSSSDPAVPGHEAGSHDQDKTAVLPETAAGLVQLEQLRTELAAAEERAKNHWDQYLRSIAEMENMRKRAARDVDTARQYAIERFAQDLVGVKDSLELGIDNAAKADVASLVEGQNATLRLLAKAFEKAQITELNPLGEIFNPEFHEAMVMQPSAEKPHGSILAVVQRGYLLNGRLLRPARVVVAQSPADAGGTPSA